MNKYLGDLTGDIRTIAEIIGRDKALCLVGQYPRYKAKKRCGSGQLLLYIPKVSRLGLDHKLVNILGYVDAVKLSHVFGGELLTLSSCKHIILKNRNDGIKDMLEQGFSIGDVASFFDLTTRGVMMAVSL